MKKGYEICIVYPTIIWKDFIVAFQYLNSAYRKVEEGIFIEDCGDRRRGNGFKLKECRYRLGIRKKLFILKAMRYWNTLLREVVDAPFPVQGQVG